MGHETEEDRYLPTLIEPLSHGHTVLVVSCGTSKTLALFEKDFISITYKSNTISLPSSAYNCIANLVDKLSRHYSIRIQDFIIVDRDGVELSHDEEVLFFLHFNYFYYFNFIATFNYLIIYFIY